MRTTGDELLGEQRGFALVEIMIVLVLLALLAGGYFALRGPGESEVEPRFAGEATTLPGRALQKGESVECMNNLSQLRQMLQMATIDTGTYPPALDPNWGVALKCPVSGYGYQYDPRTGRIYCPTPGHEKF